jgi:hypothetical protein
MMHSRISYYYIYLIIIIIIQAWRVLSVDAWASELREAQSATLQPGARASLCVVSELVRYPFYLRGRSLRAQVVPSVIV